MAATAAPCATLAAAAPRARKSSVRGPPKPNIRRLLECASKDAAEVATALGLSASEFGNVLNNRVPAIERWAPVFAKCSLLSKRGLTQLLHKQNPGDERNILPTVGQTLCQSLQQTDALERCKSSLQAGWAGWAQWRLSRREVSDLFAGHVEEAEQVADFLLKLAEVTDPTNLFCLFIP